MRVHCHKQGLVLANENVPLDTVIPRCIERFGAGTLEFTYYDKTKKQRCYEWIKDDERARTKDTA